MATKRPAKVTDKLAWRFEQPAKIVAYRESDSKYVGDEHQYPTLEEQRNWTASEYQSRLMRSLNWYAHTQDKKKSAEWLAVFWNATLDELNWLRLFVAVMCGPGLLLVSHCEPAV